MKEIGKEELKPFNLTIVEADYSRGGSKKYVITEKDIKIIGRSGNVGQKDSTLFYKTLSPTDILKEISVIDLDSLKGEYRNRSVKDGKNLGIILKKQNKEKTVFIYHQYQVTIGELVELVNYLIPSNYKIIYKKEFLEHPGKR